MKIGIIGCGTIANNAHIPNYLKNEEVEIKYFCDIIPERAQAAVEKYGCGTAVDLITGQPHDFGGGSDLPPYSCAFWKMEH